VVIQVWQIYGTEVKATSRQITAKPKALFAERQVKYPTYVVLLFLAVFLPRLLNGFWQEVLVSQIAPYVLLAVGLNVVVGFAGLLDLGYIAFYAVGAYTAAYWTGSLPVHPPFVLNPFYTIPLAIATAMIAGVILGAPTLRLRGDYLAIVTLGFGEIIQLVANNLTSVTGGSQGITGGTTGAHTVPGFSVHAGAVHYAWPEPELLPGNHLPWYYLILAMIVIVVVLFHFLENSRVGRAWVAIREDEVAAEASGINPLKSKVLCSSRARTRSSLPATSRSSSLC
jgi:branched-chain amino acid transport system permease protein